MLDIAQIKQLAQSVESEHKPMMSLYQTLADNFYPERADFTVTRNIGTEMADMLAESYPILVRRDLGDSLSSMLRDGEWFKMGVNGNADQIGEMWLQWATSRLMDLMNERQSNFSRATKEGDHDFVTFGPCVISVEPNKKRTGLLYRCWHLRDVSWFDDESGQVCGVVRKWMPTYADMIKYFGKENCADEVQKATGKDMLKKGDVRHVIVPTEYLGVCDYTDKYPYVSVFIDIKHDKILEEKGMNNKMYVIPRFKTIPGSVYAYSPATVCGLPDARALQQMQHTLLEAAERYTRPPIIATQKVIRGDVDLSADGITWVSDEYDEKMGAALRPMAQDRGGYPIGADMREKTIETLRSAFYANKLTLPNDGKERTAYEVSEFMKQYRRENLPLFSPIETEYNGQICELSFEIAFQMGLLGSPQDIPQSLMGRDIVFQFKSPLSESEEEKKVTQFQQIVAMAGQAAQLDPNSAANVNVDEALRDAMSGSGAPEKWKRLPEQVLEIRQMDAEMKSAQAAAEAGVLEGADNG